MAKYTKNLNLEKPDYDEYYDIGTFNANADKIDKGIEDSENRSTQRLDAHKQSNDHTADKIRYDGKIPKDNVKDALDETDTRIDNIVSQGGSDNTEVVDARHSTTKDKTYDTLKGRLEDSEQDIEKLKTDTSVAESVTETSYDSVISVPDNATNGQVSGVVRGQTLTNELGLSLESDDGWTYNSALTTFENGTITINAKNGQYISAIKPTNLKPNTVYTVCVDIIDNTMSEDFILLRNLDYGLPSMIRISAGQTGYIETTFKTGEITRNMFHMHTITLALDGEYIKLKNLIVVEGDYTDREIPYITGTKSTIGSARISSADDTGEIRDRAYVTAIKDGKILHLNSLPDGTRDEIDLDKGECIRKTNHIILDGSEDWRLQSVNSYGVANFVLNIPDILGHSRPIVEGFDYQNSLIADTTEEGFFIGGGGGKSLFIRIFADKLETTNVGGFQKWLKNNPTTLIYQLAEPEIIPVRWTGLQAYEGGTIYVDTVIPELGFYYDNGLESHYPDHPIKEVDTLYRVDKETGYKEPLDVSKCEIREDRLSFTHPDLVDGDLCDWDYVPMTESTRPLSSFEFPTNLKASVNSLLDAEQINKKEHNIFKASVNSLLDAEKINKKEHNIFKTRLDNHDGDIERIDDDIESIDADIENVQSDIDTHKQDSNNPHNVTPEQIGAETPSGAQAKVDVVASDFVSHKAETITDDVHGLYTHLGDLRIINFTLYSNSSVKLKFSESTFKCLLLMQGTQANAYGAFVLQGYGIGGTRYKVGEIQKGDAISISVDEEGESSFTVSNASNVTVICHLVMIGGSPPEII